MTAINLHLPQQADIDEMAGGLPDWRSYLAKLPLADPLLAARRIISSLHDTNRLPCDALSRYEFLESYRAVIKDLCIALKNFYGSAAFPLTEAEYDKATIVRQMLIELADGYKLVVHSLAEVEQVPKAPHEILLTACFRALHYLSRVILESYTAYQTVPRGIWSDLHTLYAYALAHGISQQRLLNDEDDHNEVLSIQHCYIQIVLVALANPHHLMQGETEKIYRFLNELVGLCRIVSLTQAVPLSGKLIIDPNSDNPPYFALPATTNRLPQQGWLLDNARLLDALTEIMRKRAQGHATRKAQLSFMERLEVGMLQRLERALGLRSERLSPRRHHSMMVALVSGLTGLYKVVNGGEPFSPEHDEIEIQRRLSNDKIRDHLTLIPLDDGSWKRDDAESRLDTGIHKPRLSNFGHSSDNDVWKKVYAPPVARQARNEQRNSYGQLPEPCLCEQKNESRGGLSVLFKHSSTLRVRVGNLVAFQRDREQHEDWHIGSVCWLRCAPNRNVTMGIKILAEDCLAVATRAVKGTGQGGEYFRALLIPKIDPFRHPTTLVTPAAIYDIDTIVCVNTRHDIFHARLTKLFETTSSFSRFRFDIVENPLSI